MPEQTDDWCPGERWANIPKRLARCANCGREFKLIGREFGRGWGRTRLPRHKKPATCPQCAAPMKSYGGAHNAGCPMLGLSTAYATSQGVGVVNEQSCDDETPASATLGPGTRGTATP